MLAHTRKHRISSSKQIEKDYITADEIIEEACKDFPIWAVSLAGLRYREGLTQKELGKKIKVGQYDISKMERGLRPIGKNVAKRLAKFFKTDYRMFL